MLSTGGVRSALGRADFDAGAGFDRLYDLGDVLVGTKFVAGYFQKCRNRFDHLDRNALPGLHEIWAGSSR